jgi:hypothetical protein
MKNIFSFFKKTDKFEHDDIFSEYWTLDNFHSDLMDHSFTDERDNHEVTYHMNKFDYRINDNKSDNANYFYNSDSIKNTIACFGCSNTFGQGLFWEETWTAQLNKKLGNNWLCRNFGISGSSMDTISRNIYRYTLYHRPKIICCWFPEIYRLEMFNEMCGFINVYPHIYTSITDNIENYKEMFKAYEGTMSHAYGFNNFIKNFKFIESVCKNHNIKFYWFTWSEELLKLGVKKIQKYLSLNNFLIDMLEYDVQDLSFFPPARDNAHYGAKYNEVLAESFSKKILFFENHKKLEEISNNIKNIKNK